MDLEKLFMDGRFDNSIVFGEDGKEYFSAIIGYTEDNHIIYDYDLMAQNLTERYIEDGVPEEEAYTDACEWIDYNTLRAIPYCHGIYPIVVVEDEMYEGIYHDVNNYDVLYSYSDVDSDSIIKFTKTF